MDAAQLHGGAEREGAGDWVPEDGIAGTLRAAALYVAGEPALALVPLGAEVVERGGAEGLHGGGGDLDGDPASQDKQDEGEHDAVLEAARDSLHGGRVGEPLGDVVFRQDDMLDHLGQGPAALLGAGGEPLGGDCADAGEEGEAIAFEGGEFVVGGSGHDRPSSGQGRGRR